MKFHRCLVLLAALAACSYLAAAVEPAGNPASTATEAAKSSKENKKKKKKNKKKKDKKKADSSNDKDKEGSPKEKDKAGSPKEKDKADGPKEKDKSDAIAAPVPEPAPELKPEPAAAANWCEFLADNPGRFYENKENPWFQSFTLGGRFHYQVAHVNGEDMYGRSFSDHYDEYRRFRLETRTKFLRFFTAELDVNMVSDDRFRDPPDNELDWGYDDFDTAVIECDLVKAFNIDILDELKVAYGKMKMPITEEQRQSSNAIFTLERSMLSSKLAGNESRPTGILLEAAKCQWSGRLGFFSGEDDADFVGAWNDGYTQFYSLTWQPLDEFHLSLDYTATNLSGSDDALGYASAVALGSTYETKRWGVQTSLVYGDNGDGDPTDSPRNRANRQGDFYGAGIMPWYWLVEDRLQLVCRYDYARSAESEGLQLSSRYLRGQHDDPLVDDKNGRGDMYNSWYLGLNYYLCGDNAKIMAGVQFEDMDSQDRRKVERPKKQGGDYYVTDFGHLKAFTYQIGFRTSF